MANFIYRWTNDLTFLKQALKQEGATDIVYAARLLVANYDAQLETLKRLENIEAAVNG